MSTIQLRCNFNPKAKEPPMFMSFLKDLCKVEEGQTDVDMMAMLQEWTGLILSNIFIHRTKKSLLLYSPEGNSGKSVYLSLIAHLLGIDNVANIPIQKLSARFSLGDIYGRRVICDGDNESGDIADSSVFKMLTGGDIVSAELKGKQRFSFRFTGGIQLALNDLPMFVDDRGNHLFERLLLGHCRNTIPIGKRNPMLLDELIKEADGIFLWALQGLHRLIENNYKFTEPESMKSIMQEYREHSDTVYQFMQRDCIETANDKDRIKRSEFYERYQAFCESENRKPVSVQNLPQRMAKLGHNLKKRGEYYFTGIAWNDKVGQVPPF
jgi:P4 family phage/plasmid primase-like protien